MTPYTTSSGLKIGSAYTPPPHRMSQDAEALQTVLLSKRHEQIRFDRQDRIVMTASVIAAACAVVIVCLS